MLRLYGTRMFHLRHLEINSNKLFAGDRSTIHHIYWRIGHEWLGGTNRHSFFFIVFFIIILGANIEILIGHDCKKTDGRYQNMYKNI